MPKMGTNIDFMVCDQYESSAFGKLKFVKKVNIFSDVESTAHNLLFSSITH